jgi:uncharacterized protein with PQ loop repeat
MNIIIETIGWIGSICILLAYLFNISGKIDSKSPLYIWGNLIGGACFVINTIFHHAYPSAALNIVWVMIALAALFKKQ